MAKQVKRKKPIIGSSYLEFIVKSLSCVENICAWHMPR